MLKKLIVLLSIFTIGHTSSVKHHHKHHHKNHDITKTITVTKTLKSECTGIGTGITNFPSSILPIEETNTIIEPQKTVIDDSDSVANCITIFNKFRLSQNLPPFQSASQSEIDCANKAAINDARMGYHNSFYSRMCPNARAQCECMRGVNGGGLENCINAYISEGPPGTQGQYPEENHDHWNIIVGDFTHVACGTDGNGFYTHNFY